jgi:hypothetical protein
MSKYANIEGIPARRNIATTGTVIVNINSAIKKSLCILAALRN